MRLWKFVVELFVHIKFEKIEDKQDLYTARCPDCGWERLYDSPEAAKKGLAGHQHYCTGKQQTDEIWDMMNGHK